MTTKPTLTETTLTLPLAAGTLTVTTNLPQPVATAVTLYLNGAKLLAIDAVPDAGTTRALIITPPATLEPTYLARFLAAEAKAAKLKLAAAPTGAVPSNQQPVAQAFWTSLAAPLTLLGFTLAAPAKRPAKAQHRFSKAVVSVPFTTTHAGTSATVTWRKRNEVVIAPGAHMLGEAPLNADGSLGFSARFAAQLRQEHAAEFDPHTFVTTAPVVLKSVNEVGLFLYFGGVNSWLVFKDETGKTIDAWTVVK